MRSLKSNVINDPVQGHTTRKSRNQAPTPFLPYSYDCQSLHASKVSSARSRTSVSAISKCRENSRKIWNEQINDWISFHCNSGGSRDCIGLVSVGIQLIIAVNIGRFFPYIISIWKFILAFLNWLQKHAILNYPLQPCDILLISS